VVGEASVLGIVRRARGRNSLVDVADVVQELIDQRLLRLVATRAEQFASCVSLSFGGWVKYIGAADVGAVVVELVAGDLGIPVETLEVTNTGSKLVGEVIIVCNIAQTEGVLQNQGKIVVFLSNEDVVDHVSEGLLSSDALLGTVLGNGIIILPVVIDGLGHARTGNGCPVDIRVEDAKERDVSACIGATVGDVSSGFACQIAVLLE
jgi:hypothetical protein